MKLGELPKLRARDRQGRRYLVRTDISQCYPSLYTHSIPWALHTKAYAKAHLNRTDVDKIDKTLRNVNRGQTVGIPIGPDTSLLAAEIVLTAIDVELIKIFQKLNGFRYVDDYEFSLPTLGEAESVLGTLDGLLADFEFSLNSRKTQILELPCVLQDSWANEIHAFPVRSGSPIETINDTIALYSRAFDLAGQNPSAPVMRYLLQRSRPLQVGSVGWKTFQALILSAVSVDSTAMPVALDLLDLHSRRIGAKVSLAGVSEVIEQQVARHAPLRNGSEVAWALWAARFFSIPLSAQVATAVESVEDDFVALLALHLDSRGLFPHGAPSRTTWDSLIAGADVVESEHWLLAYEGLMSGRLPGANAQLRADPFFAHLELSGVRFFNESPAHVPFSGPSGPLGGGQFGIASI